jgi:uncharacterized protein YukE
MVRMGMDVDAVESAGKQLKAQANSITNLVSQLDRTVNALPSSWDGQDARQFVTDWWPQHKQALLAAQKQLDGLGQSALNNASEQRNASGSGGKSGSTAANTGATTAAGGVTIPNVGNMYRDASGSTPIWPISVGTALSMTPAGGVLPFTDAAALALDDRESWPDKFAEQAHASVDVAGGEIRQAGFDQHNLPLYLVGVATSQYGDVASEFSKADFSSAQMNQNANYVASDPGGAFDAARDAVIGYVPKLVSNWTFNPFAK